MTSPWEPETTPFPAADRSKTSEVPLPWPRSGVIPEAPPASWDPALAADGGGRVTSPVNGTGPPATATGTIQELPASWAADPAVGSTTLPDELPAQPSVGEEWVYVDPASYSNPYSLTPIYTSGAQSIPTAIPPPPVEAAQILHESPNGIDQNATQGATEVSRTDGSGDLSMAPGWEPEKGELKIKERRTWKTWQLAVVAVAAAVLGMWFNGNAGSASGTSATTGYKLPPASGSSPATTVAGTSPAGGAAASATTTTTAGGTSTSTTVPGAVSAAGGASTGVAGGSTTTSPPAAVGPPTVLVPETQQTGNWTSPAFTIAGGTWNIGWAFQCAPAPSGGPSFQVFAVTNGGAPSGSPAVTSTAASGQAVTPLTSTGSQQVIVQTTAACRWAVKVTGSSS